MKTRKSFVTNSSSSCYICQICGNQESGWDMCLSEANMVMCENGHTVCENHSVFDSDISIEEQLKVLIDRQKRFIEKQNNYILDNNGELAMKQLKRLNNDLKKLQSFNPDDNEDDIYDLWSDMIYCDGISSYFCPVCNFECAVSDDLLKYILKRSGINESHVLNLIKKEFSSYEQFEEFLKNN